MATQRSFSRQRLRGHRDGRGMSRADLAGAAERTQAAVKSYEDGVCQPPAGALIALADALGVTVDDLYSRHDDSVEDYLDAVASHCRPLTDTELEAAAVVFRQMNPRHMRGITGAEPDEPALA